MSNDLPDLGPSPSLADLIASDPDAQTTPLLSTPPLTLSKVQPTEQIEQSVGIAGFKQSSGPIVNETPPPPMPEYVPETEHVAPANNPESVIAPPAVAIPVVPVAQPLVSVEAPTALPGEETAEQTIARLQREIAANAPAVAAAQAKQEAQRPKPESELTPEERQIRRLQDQAAQQQAMLLSSADDIYDTTQGEPGSVLRIHILKEGGITLNGSSWYRGQEIDFVIGSQAYLDTFDRMGFSPLQIAGDARAQYQKWGEIRYGVGDWPGRASEDPAVINGEARRDRRAPVIPTR